MAKTPKWMIVVVLVVLAFWCLAYLGPPQMVESAVKGHCSVAAVVVFSWLLPARNGDEIV